MLDAAMACGCAHAVAAWSSSDLRFHLSAPSSCVGSTETIIHPGTCSNISFLPGFSAMIFSTVFLPSRRKRHGSLTQWLGAWMAALPSR